MNKIMCLLFCSLLTNVIWSQQLFVSATGDMTITPTSYVYIGGNVEIAATGNLTVVSNATHSASLIAASGSVTGNITYNRYIPATGSSWNHVAPPVGTQDVQTFVADANNGIRTNPTTGNYAVATWKSENAVNKRWTYHNEAPTSGVVNQQTLGNFVNGQVYTTSRTGAGTYTFTGAMATTDVTKAIGGAGSNWTLIGNPYPSFLSASAVYTANASVLDASAAGLYLWNPEGEGSWTVFNAASTDQQLHPGKGFFVKAKTGAMATTTQDFVFSEALQTAQGTTDAFFRTTPQQKVVVNLTSATGSATTTLKYFSNTTQGFDLGWDATSFDGETTSFSIDTHLVADSEGVNYTLQCLNDSAYEDAPIALAVKAGANEEITFSALASNLPADMDVYLEDKLNNTIQKINDASYTVLLTAAIEGIGNFYLHTSRTTLKTEELLPTVSTLTAYTTNNTNLRITGFTTPGGAVLKMHNTLGQQVFAHDFTIQNVNDIALPSVRTGVYIVQVGNGVETLTKKIVLE